MSSLSSREEGLSATLIALARSGARGLGVASPVAAWPSGGAGGTDRFGCSGLGGRLERSGLGAPSPLPVDGGVDPWLEGLRDDTEGGAAPAWPGGGKEGDASDSAAACASAAPIRPSVVGGRRADGGNGGGLLWRPLPPGPSQGATDCPGLALEGPCGPRGGGRDLVAAGGAEGGCAALASPSPGEVAVAAVRSAAARASATARWSSPPCSAASAARLKRTAASSVSPLKKSTRAVSSARTTSSESPGCGTGNWGSVTVPPRFLARLAFEPNVPFLGEIAAQQSLAPTGYVSSVWSAARLVLLHVCRSIGTRGGVSRLGCLNTGLASTLDLPWRDGRIDKRAFPFSYPIASSSA